MAWEGAVLAANSSAWCLQNWHSLFVTDPGFARSASRTFSPCSVSYTKCVSIKCSTEPNSSLVEDVNFVAPRRAALVYLGYSVGSVAVCGGKGSAFAVQQTLLAGRIPGLSDPDGNGIRTYRRPDAKSGGHGVGWSPIIPYSFKVPQDWSEIPVSIADLGGTEIDLRFQSTQEGNISVVVAPVLRFAKGSISGWSTCLGIASEWMNPFADLGDNVKIEDIGVPEKVIAAFGPEIVGQNVEGKVKEMEVKDFEGRTYYRYELDSPHMFISTTAAGNRLYLFSVSGNGRQWKKFSSDLKQIADSFRVG